MQEREVNYIKSCLATGQRVGVVYDGLTYQVQKCVLGDRVVLLGLVIDGKDVLVDADRTCLTGRLD